ncbi:MAG: archaeal flagellar protein FlaI, partial [Pyrococcus sp.]|nr:archaeal flagellar protein FlaI [Pyrococcus sp.]
MGVYEVRKNMEEDKKKKKSWIDEILSSDNLSLESILKKSEEEKPKKVSVESKSLSLGDILSGRVKEEEKKREASPLQSLLGGGPPKLEEILKKEEPKREEKKPKIERGALGLQEILAGTTPRTTSYAGEVRVLDVYGNIRILKVKGEPVPIYEINMPKLSKEEERLVKMVRDRAIVEIQIDP